MGKAKEVAIPSPQPLWTDEIFTGRGGGKCVVQDKWSGSASGCRRSLIVPPRCQNMSNWICPPFSAWCRAASSADICARSRLRVTPDVTCSPATVTDHAQVSGPRHMTAKSHPCARATACRVFQVVAAMSSSVADEPRARCRVATISAIAFDLVRTGRRGRIRRARGPKAADRRTCWKSLHAYGSSARRIASLQRYRNSCRITDRHQPTANWKGEVEDQVVMKLARLCRQAATIRSWTSFLISAVRAPSATRMPSGSDAQKSSGSPPAPFHCAK